MKLYGFKPLIDLEKNSGPTKFRSSDRPAHHFPKQVVDERVAERKIPLAGMVSFRELKAKLIEKIRCV